MRHFALALALGTCAMMTANADSEVPADAVVAELPFLQVDEPNRIYVDLGPEGRPLNLFLDTGASHSVFTPLAARAAGVSVRALKNTPYRRQTRVGRDLQFWVDTRTSDTGSKTGWEYGLLGGNFLRDFVVELDFSARTVRLIDPKRFEVPASSRVADEAVLPMRAGSPRPVIEIGVGDRKLAVLLDTGAHVTAVLSGKAAKKVGIDAASLPAFGELGTALGPMAVSLYEMPDLSIGNFHFAKVPVLVAPKGWYNAGGEANDSVIGYDVISRFLVRIDYPRARLWLRRQSEKVPFLGVDYQITREAGVVLDPWGRNYVVSSVFPNTPAARLGLLAGDTLLKERAGTAERMTLEEVLTAIKAGRPVRVARRMNDVWIDVDLPDDPLLDPAAAAARDED